MVARPLVQGADTRGTVGAAAAHTAAMLAGSAFVASLLAIAASAAGALPPIAVAVVCLGAAVAVATRLPVPGSHWMVPREWARLGAAGHAACFGFALGTGVATLLPSAAFYALLAAAEAAPSRLQTYALLLTFGAARSVMVAVLTARSVHRGVHPVAGIDRLRDAMARLGGAEAVLLTTLGIELLLLR